MSVYERIADALVPAEALRVARLDADEEAVLRLLTGLVEVVPARPLALAAPDFHEVPWPRGDQLDDFDGVLIHADEVETPDLEDVAAMVVHELRRRREVPGPLSWRRWKVTYRASSWLYVAGLSRGGHSWTMDYSGSYVSRFPSVDLRRGDRLRPYVLGKQAWWWECHRRQGWRLRGRHRPQPPFGFGVCAACSPCPECGALYACEPGCAL